MKKLPRIGLTAAYKHETTLYTCRKNYVKAVREAGGMVYLLPPAAEKGLAEAYAAGLDGLLLTGGGDVHPRFFGGYSIWELEEVSLMRDTFEIELVKAMVASAKPILGICRGIQVINVALGGTLYQDLRRELPGSLQHRQDSSRSEAAHKVKLKEGSLLFRLLGASEIWVNSLHHQAVKDLAPGLRQSAFAEDGVIEALEGLSGFLLGVQWHPEDLVNEEHAKVLFQGLVAAAKDI
jgi:putative glutamine amidotransferase